MQVEIRDGEIEGTVVVTLELDYDVAQMILARTEASDLETAAWRLVYPLGGQGVG